MVPRYAVSQLAAINRTRFGRDGLDFSLFLAVLCGLYRGLGDIWLINMVCAFGIVPLFIGLAYFIDYLVGTL